MHGERPGDAPYVGDLEALWLYVSALPRELTGRPLREALFTAFASALQIRWLHGGYQFDLVESTRPPAAGVEAHARKLLHTRFPGARDEDLALVWCEPLAALDDFLDRWLFFRRSRSYVRQDDVPAWMMPALREPWAACVRELLGAVADARAAVLEGFGLTPAWGDHGVALLLTAGTRVSLLFVRLETD